MKQNIVKFVDEHLHPTFDFIEESAEEHPKAGKIILTGLVIAFPVWCMFSLWAHDD